MSGDDASDGFLSRWSRRKTLARAAPEANVAEPTVVEPTLPEPDLPEPAARTSASAIDEPEQPAPTMDDVARLTPESDYAPFLARNVDLGVKRAAMKRLFADPHFNVMDGLDTYIDDYGRPDPIPSSMLRQLNQSTLLRLFEVEEAPQAVMAGASEAVSATEPPDDDPDLRLQQDDDAGRAPPEPGPRA